MIVLDTDVLSGIFRPRPEPGVVTWLAAVPAQVAITAVTLAELLAGVRRLPDGRRRKALSRHIDMAVAPYLDDGSVLSFDASAAEQYAEVLTAREAAGMPISTADAQIAAICRVQDATCATRNAKDFVGTGVRVVEPWTV